MPVGELERFRACGRHQPLVLPEDPQGHMTLPKRRREPSMVDTAQSSSSESAGMTRFRTRYSDRAAETSRTRNPCKLGGRGTVSPPSTGTDAKPPATHSKYTRCAS